MASAWHCPSCQRGCAYCNGSEGEVPASPEPGGPATPVTIHLEIGGSEIAEIVKQYTLLRARRNRNGPDGQQAA
jgi:hypothetical protein